MRGALASRLAILQFRGATAMLRPMDALVTCPNVSASAATIASDAAVAPIDAPPASTRRWMVAASLVLATLCLGPACGKRSAAGAGPGHAAVGERTAKLESLEEGAGPAIVAAAPIAVGATYSREMSMALTSSVNVDQTPLASLSLPKTTIVFVDTVSSVGEDGTVDSTMTFGQSRWDQQAAHASVIGKLLEFALKELSNAQGSARRHAYGDLQTFAITPAPGVTPQVQDFINSVMLYLRPGMIVVPGPELHAGQRWSYAQDFTVRGVTQTIAMEVLVTSCSGTRCSVTLSGTQSAVPDQEEEALGDGKSRKLVSLEGQLEGTGELEVGEPWLREAELKWTSTTVYATPSDPRGKNMKIDLTATIGFATPQ